MSSVFKEKPQTILSSKGAAHVGAYYGSFNQAPVLRSLGLSLPALQQAIGHKKWHFIGISTDEIFIACAIVDVGYTGSSFVQIVDLKSGTVLKDTSFLGIPKVNLHVNDCPGEGARASFNQLINKISLTRNSGSLAYELSIKLPGCEVSATLQTKSKEETLVVIGGQKKHRFAFTQKVNLLPTKGYLKIKGREWSLDSALSSLDYTAGIYPREIYWYWGFGQGRLENGSPIGFNLTKGNNLGGQSENALWVNNKLYPVGEAEFILNKKNHMYPWKVRTMDGIIDLEYRPMGIHREHKNFVLVKSQFQQILGLYSGTIKDPETGKLLVVENLPGIGEDQYIKW